MSRAPKARSNDYRDPAMPDGCGWLTHSFSGTSRIFVQDAYDRRDYKNPGSLNRESDGGAFAIGVDGACGSLAGEMLVGFFVHDYSDPALNDVATFDVCAALIWMPEPLTRVRLSLDRDIAESTVYQNGVAASSHTATLFRARALRRVAPQVSIGADMAWEIDSDNGVDRTDPIGSFGGMRAIA
jgi:hypothetical protein